MSAPAMASLHPPSPAATREEAAPQSHRPLQLPPESSPTPTTFLYWAHLLLPSSLATHSRSILPPRMGAALPHRGHAYLPLLALVSIPTQAPAHETLQLKTTKLSILSDRSIDDGQMLIATCRRSPSSSQNAGPQLPGNRPGFSLYVANPSGT